MKVTLSLILMSVLIGCIPEIGNNNQIRRFDKTLWSNKDSISYNVRYQMLEDLQKNYLTTGKTRAEVTELLGPWDSLDSVDTGISINYEVGNEGLDPCYLEIILDSIQRVSTYRVSCH